MPQFGIGSANQHEAIIILTTADGVHIGQKDSPRMDGDDDPAGVRAAGP